MGAGAFWGGDLIRLNISLGTLQVPIEDVEKYQVGLELCHYDTVSRDVLVPREMPLYRLHYLIQKLFRLDNIREHSFELPGWARTFVCGNTYGNALNQVGIMYACAPQETGPNIWARPPEQHMDLTAYEILSRDARAHDDMQKLQKQIGRTLKGMQKRLNRVHEKVGYAMTPTQREKFDRALRESYLSTDPPPESTSPGYQRRLLKWPNEGVEYYRATVVTSSPADMLASTVAGVGASIQEIDAVKQVLQAFTPGSSRNQTLLIPRVVYEAIPGKQDLPYISRAKSSDRQAYNGYVYFATARPDLQVDTSRTLSISEATLSEAFELTGQKICRDVLESLPVTSVLIPHQACLYKVSAKDVWRDPENGMFAELFYTIFDQMLKQRMRREELIRQLGLHMQSKQAESARQGEIEAMRAAIPWDRIRHDPPLYQVYTREQADRCLDAHQTPITPQAFTPILFYRYGDLVFYIRASTGAQDLIQAHLLTEQQVRDAAYFASRHHRPYLLFRDGVDVGEWARTTEEFLDSCDVYPYDYKMEKRMKMSESERQRYEEKLQERLDHYKDYAELMRKSNLDRWRRQANQDVL